MGFRRTYSATETHSRDCPECGATVTWETQKNRKTFRAKLKRCTECGRVFR